MSQKAVDIAIQLVEAEPELPSDPPPGFEDLLKTVGLVASQRLLVRTTKDCIIKRIREEMPKLLSLKKRGPLGPLKCCNCGHLARIHGRGSRQGIKGELCQDPDCICPGHMLKSWRK